ncbi:MAG: SPFH domain-containing protein [Candidatus Eisenbacteria bacterium]|nr:SPFH domain-containing protein [Candidatus Eisenbacteria bacterium]
MQEKPAHALPGIPTMLLLLLVLAGSLTWLIIFAVHQFAPGVISMAVTLLVSILFLGGLTVVNPNDACVVQLFGTYVGSVKQQGFWWVNPFTTRKRISLRIRNFESAKLKVNDHDGNPIEIAAVVVWKVVESAEAAFEVDNYENFVTVQSEAALRNLSTTHPYDTHVDGETSLRGNTAEIAEQLKKEIQDRLSKAGVQVIESRISHLAYAPEIASAMLQRQQAGAIIAARTRIVEGAVSMVEMALEKLAEKKTVTLDEDRKAAMVSNLLVVLCSDRHAQPVVNTGTLYQ